MDYAYFISLFIFAIGMSFSPGPNNITLTALGMNVGFQRGMPYLLGILTGFTCLNIAVAAGLGSLFQTFSSLQIILRFVGAGYLVYLAWKIASASVNKNKADEKGQKPLPYVGGFLFQWINPKAWIMSITTFSSFSLSNDLLISSMIAVIITFLVTGAMSSMFWLTLGVQAARFLTTSQARRIFNYCLAFILLVSVVYILGNF